MKILFISTEVWSLKNPEGIVARKLVSGLIQSNIVDVLSTKRISIEGINKEIIVENNSVEILSKIKKKITGIEKKDFVNSVINNLSSLLEIESYELVITRSEPFFLHEIGCYIKRKYPKIKWIASFGDPVFLNPYNSNSLLKKHTAKKLEQKYWHNADLVTHTNQTVINEYKKYGFNIHKAFVLENPFIYDDNEADNEIQDGNIITFAYVGSLYGKRSIEPVAKFLSQVNFKFKLLIIGGVRNTYYENRFGSLTKYLMQKDKKKINKSIKKYNIEDRVEMLPFIAKEKLDDYLKKNVDVLINIDACIGQQNIFLSSKVVEYLQYRKPILNFSIRGASVDFLNDVGVNFFIDLNSNLNDVSFSKDDIKKLVPYKNIENYTAKAICNRLISKI